MFHENSNGINAFLFGEKYDNDKDIKLDKIKEFQKVLAEFVKKHEKTISVNDIEQFINDQKQNLIDIGVENPVLGLLCTFSCMYKGNDLSSINNFLGLMDKSKPFTKLTSDQSKIIFSTKCCVYMNYINSQSCDNNLFKKIVNDLLSGDYLGMDEFCEVIKPVFVRDNNKELVKQDCFNYIFELLKQRFKGEKIKNIYNLHDLLAMMCWTFGREMIQSAGKNVFEYMLELTKEADLPEFSNTDFGYLFRVFSDFKAEFWDSSDLKDECWIAQYNRFRIMTLDFLAANSYKRDDFSLSSKLTDEDIVIGGRANYKQAVKKFIENEYILAETRFMVMYCCSKLYGTDTKFLKEISAGSFSGIDSFFSDCEKVRLGYDLADCLLVFSTNAIADFIKQCVDINENNCWKFLAIWESIVKKCRDKKSSVQITDFFPTPNDLFNFYKKITPGFQYERFLDIKNSKNQDEYITDIYLSFCDLDICLRKYDNTKMANFIKEKNNEPCESLFIWICLRRSLKSSWWEELFSKPEDIIDFYIDKIPDEFKNLENFYVFLHAGCICYDKKLWKIYFKSILEKKNRNHIQLFLDFFDGKINFNNKEYKIRIIMETIFNSFDDLERFLDFYVQIYLNSGKNLLKEENIERDYILQLMINSCEWNLTTSLLDICKKKYGFYVPLSIISKDYLDLCDLSYIVQFLSKKNGLDQDLKIKLLKKIDDQVEERCIELLSVEYNDKPSNQYKFNTFRYPYDFKTKLKCVIEIMDSKDVLPETKKRIYDWAKNAYKKDQTQWKYVLEMCLRNIQRSEPAQIDNISLSKWQIGQEDMMLPTLKNEENSSKSGIEILNNQVETIQNQIEALNNQITTLNNNLSATEFKFEWNWNLFVWFSGIGTICRLVQRYFWNQNLSEVQNRKSALELQKQNLGKTKETMKKWGKCKNSTDCPYDKHEEYCASLKQIIDTYERQQNIQTHNNKSNNLIPPQEKENIINILDLKHN